MGFLDSSIGEFGTALFFMARTAPKKRPVLKVISGWLSIVKTIVYSCTGHFDYAQWPCHKYLHAAPFLWLAPTGVEGLQSATSCRFLPTRLRSLSPTSCRLFLPLGRRSLRGSPPAGFDWFRQACLKIKKSCRKTTGLQTSSYGSRTRLSTLRGSRTKPIFEGAIKKSWLIRSALGFPKEDSNPHNQNQNLKCYHYTIGECDA